MTCKILQDNDINSVKSTSHSTAQIFDQSLLLEPLLYSSTPSVLESRAV
jgi:hypothetical protein